MFIVLYIVYLALKRLLHSCPQAFSMGFKGRRLVFVEEHGAMAFDLSTFRIQSFGRD